MYYATLDYDGSRIIERARIKGFATRQEAEHYLKTGYPARDGWQQDTIEIGVGSFGEAWHKSLSAPKLDGDRLSCGYLDFEPFTADQLNIAEQPSTHLGGPAWWITPNEAVLVVLTVRR